MTLLIVRVVLLLVVLLSRLALDHGCGLVGVECFGLTVRELTGRTLLRSAKQRVRVVSEAAYFRRAVERVAGGEVEESEERAKSQGPGSNARWKVSGKNVRRLAARKRCEVCCWLVLVLAHFSGVKVPMCVEFVEESKDLERRTES